MDYFGFFNVLYVLLSFSALVICWCAYRLSRNAGYLLIACGILFGIMTAEVLPALNKARVVRWARENQLPIAVEQAYLKDMVALSTKYYPSGSTLPPRNISIRFPVTSLLTVAGLWLLAGRESRKHSEPSAGGNAAPPRASA